VLPTLGRNDVVAESFVVLTTSVRDAGEKREGELGLGARSNLLKPGKILYMH
jgi:hypothetical protein